MTVTIRPVGVLRTFVHGKARLILEGKEGQSLERVCAELGVPLSMVALYLVNGEPRGKDYRLRSDDEVKVVALVGGG
jgi:sulfur carrier protein ThiS